MPKGGFQTLTVKFSASLLNLPPSLSLAVFLLRFFSLFIYFFFTHFTSSLLWLLALTKSTDSGQRELTVCL